MPVKDADLLRAYARLLRYPALGAEYVTAILDDALALSENDARAMSFLLQARGVLAALDDTGMEEAYTRAFDVNPAVTLDVGYHLFGLAYKRGDFLVKMQAALREQGIEQGSELADHLPLLLDLTATLPEPEGRTLIEECIAPALKRMADPLASADPGYPSLILALRACLSEGYGCAPVPQADAFDELSLDEGEALQGVSNLAGSPSSNWPRELASQPRELACWHAPEESLPADLFDRRHTNHV